MYELSNDENDPTERGVPRSGERAGTDGAASDEVDGLSGISTSGSSWGIDGIGRGGLGERARGRWNASGWANILRLPFLSLSGLGLDARRLLVDALGLAAIAFGVCGASKFELDTDDESLGGEWSDNSGGGWRRNRDLAGVGDLEREGEREDRKLWNGSIGTLGYHSGTWVRGAGGSPRPMGIDDRVFHRQRWCQTANVPPH